MNERKIYKIEEIIEKVGMGPFGSSIKVETFVADGIPVISGTHLKGTRLEDKDFNFISIEHADKLKNANVKRGDVIFTHAGNIGAVAFIPENSRYERYILSQRQFYLRCNKEKLLPEYITYYFKTPLGQRQLLANTSSVGVPSIAQPVTYLRSIEVEIPIIKEQEQVINILDALENKIELNLQMNQTLEAMAQALFKEWCCVEEGIVPKGWSMKKLSDIADVSSSKRIFREEYTLIGIPFYRGKEVTQLSNGESISTELFISNERYNEIKEKFGVPQIGDILITSVGTIGSVWLIDNNLPFYFKDGNVTWIKDYKTGINGAFVYQWLQTKEAKEQIKSVTIGSTQEALTISALKGLDILIPDKETVFNVCNQLESLNAKRINNINQIQTLTQTRDTLLPKLMSGKIEIV